MLIDSDVLIWLTRGHVGAAQRLAQIKPWKISAVTYMELAQGCRNKAELVQLKKGLAAANTEIIPITENISNQASALIDSYALSHGLKFADALIAATALSIDGELLTGNGKHFNCVPNVRLEIFSA